MSAEGFFGPGEQSLVDMVQMWGLNCATGILAITSGQEQGEVHLRGGRVVFACSGPYLLNEDAIYHLLALREGKFRFVNTNNIEKKGNWTVSYQEIIMEGMRRLDHLNDEMRSVKEQFGLIPFLRKDPETLEIGESEKVFLGLIDGKRNLGKVFNCSGLGAYRNLELFNRFTGEGVLELRKVRVLVVDDQNMWRQILSNMLEKEPCFEIAGTAEDGVEALKLLSELKPDVMTLDLEMPRMDGIKTLYWMMSGGYDIVLKSYLDVEIEETYRCPVVVISAVATKMAPETLDALMGGASGYITKPSQVVTESLEAQQQRIARTVLMASQVDLSKSRRLRAKDIEKQPPSEKGVRKLVCAGASVLGGLTSLMQLVPALPRDMDAALYVVIDDLGSLPHARSFAEFLDRHSEVNVLAAEKNMILRQGCVYISPGCQSTLFGVTTAGQTAFKTRDTKEASPEGGDAFRPIDDMLLSALRCKGFDKKVGVVLAGDGADGKLGFLELVKMGNRVFAQDSYSSLSPAKPEAIASMGIAKIVPLDDMVRHILDEVGRAPA